MFWRGKLHQPIFHLPSKIHHMALCRTCKETESLEGPTQMQSKTKQLRLNQGCKRSSGGPAFPQHNAAQALTLTSGVHGDEAGLATDTQGPWWCLPDPSQLLLCLYAEGSLQTPNTVMQFKLCDLVEGMYTILNALRFLFFLSCPWLGVWN